MTIHVIEIAVSEVFVFNVYASGNNQFDGKGACQWWKKSIFGEDLKRVWHRKIIVVGDFSTFGQVLPEPTFVFFGSSIP